MTRHRKNQARIRLHQRRIALGLTVTGIAKTVGHDTAVVSKAINHGCYPRVIAKIQEVLNAG
jgi:hypothetical protein